MINKKYISIIFVLLVMFSLNLVLGATSTPQSTVCCERTTNGAWCQNTLPSNCNPSYSQTPSSCDSTSFCSIGTCYDSTEGTCAEKTSQKACQESGGVWSAGTPEEVPQCQAGCCVLGDQAAFTTQVRCKKLSSFYGLDTDFRNNIGTENECVALTQAKDEGACVYEVDFSKTCKFTTRSDCIKIKDSNFFKDFLCSSDELGANCGPTTKTTCLANKDEVHFVDSCGNPANIYDSTKVNDKAYWNKVIPKEESCNAYDSKGNANSVSCGNCEYIAGSICKNYQSTTSKIKPTYGNFICQDLNCKDTFNENDYKHGESWCVNDNDDAKEDSVGSRHYRHVCIAGEEIVEPCADFRQEVCIQDSIQTSVGDFAQAACRVNRWQSCSKQDGKASCENIDQRDCNWIGGSLEDGGRCVPSISPGLNFWSEDTVAIDTCKKASDVCTVEFESGLLGGEKCVKNCQCLDDSWIEQRKTMCDSLGDCGGKLNVIKVRGSGRGYSITN